MAACQSGSSLFGRLKVSQACTLQYAYRRKTHHLLWTVAMLTYSISATMEFLRNPDVPGVGVSLFRIHFVLAAGPVGPLGAGVMYLHTRKPIARMRCATASGGFLGQQML